MNRSLFALAAAALFSGCPSQPGMTGQQGVPGASGQLGPQGPEGPAGPIGPQGPPGDVVVLDGGTIVGPRGAPGASVVVTAVLPGGPCPAGGVSLSLEDGGSTQLVCNGVMGSAGPMGALGAPGAQGASVVVVAIDGGACPFGGVRVEVDGGTPAYVCNGAPGGIGSTGSAGPTGATGAAGGQGPAGASVTVTALSAGDSNCPAGGARFVAGATTTYACNGAPGPSGPPGNSGGSGDGGGGFGTAGSEGYVFAGFTVASYTGDLGGLQGAHAKCAAEYAGAHLCTDREYEVIGSAATIPAGGAWVDFARYISSSTPTATPRDRERSYSCNEWRATTGAYSGALDSFGSYSRTTANLACSTVRPLACCRAPQSAWFRGFTVQASAGDLGGVRGAHARCAAEYPGSHFCTDREYEQAASPTPLPAAGAWVDFARYISSSTPSATPRDRERSYSCNEWQATTGAYSGALDTFGSYSRTTANAACGTVRPLACCSN